MAVPNKHPLGETISGFRALVPYFDVNAETECDETFENDASKFKAKSVACVVQDETKISRTIQAYRALGFEGACTNSLEAAFEVVCEDPEEWAMIVIVLDRRYSKTELASWVHLIRMMDFRIPIMLLSDQGPHPHWDQDPTRLGDCCLAYPTTPNELDAALGVAVRANQKLGLHFRHFKAANVPRPSPFRHRSGG